MTKPTLVDSSHYNRKCPKAQNVVQHREIEYLQIWSVIKLGQSMFPTLTLRLWSRFHLVFRLFLHFLFYPQFHKIGDVSRSGISVLFLNLIVCTYHGISVLFIHSNLLVEWVVFFNKITMINITQETKEVVVGKCQLWVDCNLKNKH